MLIKIIQIALTLILLGGCVAAVSLIIMQPVPETKDGDTIDEL